MRAIDRVHEERVELQLRVRQWATVRWPRMRRRGRRQLVRLAVWGAEKLLKAEEPQLAHEAGCVGEHEDEEDGTHGYSGASLIAGVERHRDRDLVEREEQSRCDGPAAPCELGTGERAERHTRTRKLLVKNGGRHEKRGRRGRCGSGFVLFDRLWMAVGAEDAREQPPDSALVPPLWLLLGVRNRRSGLGSSRLRSRSQCVAASESPVTVREPPLASRSSFGGMS